MSTTTIKFLGHTTILVKTQDVNFIFDPNFSKKIFAIKRKDKPIIEIDDLHQVNAILISNAHRNRLDPASLKYFKQTAQIVIPMGLGKLVNSHYHFHVNELKAGAQTTIGDCEIIAFKSLHRGFRKIGLGNSLCLHYLLKTPDRTIFYCSDTSYQGAFFHDIGKEHKIDVAILPIDHVGPDWASKKKHLSPAQAIQAFQDLQAKKMIPYAYGSFNFSGRAKDKVLNELDKEIEAHNFSESVHILQPGQFF